MSKSVLVVDDSTFMRKRIKEKLTDLGYNVIAEARDGNEAIQMYDLHTPELVTMDITMRGKDGLNASSEILAKHPDAQIFILTMIKEDGYQQMGQNIGVKGFLLKDDLEKLGDMLNETK
jgi:two-component system chemotaxis response regulator CheY